jgi:RNA-directed DNA polymerase
MTVLPKRFARFGLTIHPTKTALIAFRKPKAHQGSESGNGTCTFLGLTHYWTKSRQGFWVIKRRTASKRLRRTKKSLCPSLRQLDTQINKLR